MDDKRMNENRSEVHTEVDSGSRTKIVYEAPAIVSEDTVFERPALSCVDPNDHATFTCTQTFHPIFRCYDRLALTRALNGRDDVQPERLRVGG